MSVTTDITEEYPLDLDEHTKEQRAKRLRVLRQLTNLSRDKFQERYGIARGTLQNWESARFGGLTEKGAKSIILAITAEGVYCDLQWLLHGIGQEPRLLSSSGITDSASNRQTITVDQSEAQTIAEELICFRSHNQDCIDLMVTDDSMAPIFQPGDFVAGNKRYMEEIDRTIGFYCILQTAQYGTILRYIKQGDDHLHYHLIATNAMSEMNNKPNYYNTKVISSAPVIWHRSPNVAVNTA